MLVVLQMTAILWPEQAKVQDGARFSFIIVGGGSAGCVLANRLSEESRFSVLLIEAGGDPPFESMLPGLMGYFPQTLHDWNYTEQYDRNREIYQDNLVLPLQQGRVLGGGSSVNFMYYVRGNPHDYDTWADIVGDQSWNYDHVLPYFKKSEPIDDFNILNSKYRRFHGTEGYLHLTRQPYPEVRKYTDMFHELGHKIRLDVNGEDTTGFVQPTLTIAKGIRQSAAYSFLRPIKNRPNLYVLRHTLVTRILVNEFKNAIGVEALKEDRRLITIMADREVIVTAGAFKSAQLLLLSGIGPKEHLDSLGIKVVSDLPVGNYLQDHTASLVAYKFKKSNEAPPTPDYSRLPVPHFAGYTALNKSQTYPDYKTICFIIPHDTEGALSLCSFMFNQMDDTCQAIYEAGKGRETLLCVNALMHPKSHGTVRLRSLDPEDYPLITLQSYSNEEDLEIMIKTLQELDRIRTSSYYKKVGGEVIDHRLPQCRGLEFGSKKYWGCHALSTKMTMWHYCGSCGMRKVLDSRLNVLGVGRLRVADSSAIPRIPRGNINAAVMMTAEKAADMIKEDHGEI